MVQEAFFDTLLFLNSQSLVDLSGFERHVNFHSIEEPARSVGRMLKCFQFVRETYQSKYTAGFYDTSVLWLAQMIVRGALVDDLDIIVQCILMEGILGELDSASYREAWHQDRKLLRDSYCGTVKEGFPSVRCWFIPRIWNPNSKPIVDEVTSKFDSRLKQFDDSWTATCEFLNNSLPVVNSSVLPVKE